MESLRPIVTKGAPKLGIPVLDPYVDEDFEYEYENSFPVIGSIYIRVQGLTVENLRNYVLLLKEVDVRDGFFRFKIGPAFLKAIKMSKHYFLMLKSLYLISNYHHLGISNVF